MNYEGSGVVFIGPVCTGKSTQGKLVSEAINKRSISLDPIAAKYAETHDEILEAIS